METLPLTDDRFVSSSDGLSDGLSGSLGSVGLFGLLGSVGVVGVVPPLEPPLLPPPPELLLPSEPVDSLSTDTLICVSCFRFSHSIRAQIYRALHRKRLCFAAARSRTSAVDLIPCYRCLHNVVFITVQLNFDAFRKCLYNFVQLRAVFESCLHPSGWIISYVVTLAKVSCNRASALRLFVAVLTGFFRHLNRSCRHYQLP